MTFRRRLRTSAVALTMLVVGAMAGTVPADPLPGPPEGAPQDLYAYALFLHLQGNDRAAAEYFHNLLVDSGPPPQADRLLFNLAACRAAVGEYDKAVESLMALVSSRPESPLADDALLAAGRIWADDIGRPAEAIETYKRLRNEFPDSPLRPVALLEIGRAMEQLEKFDEAVAAYDQVLAAAKRLPEGEAPAAARLAGERRRFILAAGDDERQPLRMYLKAERLAQDPATRNEALLTLIRLTALCPDSSLVDDAFAQKLRIHLLKGEEAAARQALDRLVADRPTTLCVEPIRSCAVTIAGWLLGDMDRQIASNAEVLPELVGYRAGRGVTAVSGSPPPKRLTLDFESGEENAGLYSRHLRFHVVVERPDRFENATYPNLNLRVEFSISTGSDIAEREIRQGLKRMTDTLSVLDAAAGPHSGSGTETGRPGRAAGERLAAGVAIE